jgi:hypothetical protein
VIQAGSATIAGTDDTRSIELEGATSGINSDCQWVGGELSLDIIDAGGDLAVAGNITDSLASVVSTLSFSTGVS